MVRQAFNDRFTRGFNGEVDSVEAFAGELDADEMKAAMRGGAAVDAAEVPWCADVFTGDGYAFFPGAEETAESGGRGMDVRADNALFSMAWL